MIYVDADLLQPPKEWADQAATVMLMLIAASSDERDTIIEQHSALWRDLKENLRLLSHGKCWYCESIEIRSDCPIDHFRPKKRVAGVPLHPGYWWLAFDTENFRFCCTFCNSRRIDQETGVGGGKADHFPLEDEARRAYTPEDDAFAECPTLLDPTDPQDPPLLWFDERGEATPRRTQNENAADFRRAETSIELYHLNHSQIVSSRAAVAATIRRRVKNVDAYFGRQSPVLEAAARQALRSELKEIKRLLDRATPLSATARCVLQGYRSRPWVEQLL
jgi:uncharacterized protein (TIGR02646 family)